MCKRIRVVLALAILVVFSAKAWPVEMQANAGLGGRYRTGSWLPVSINLKNTSDDDFVGTIALFDTYNNRPSSFQSPFELPGTSQKRYSYYCLQDLTINSSGLTLKMLPSKGSAPEKELQAQCSISEVPQFNALVVAAGSPSSTLNFLNGIKLANASATTAGQECKLDVGQVEPQMLPDRPLGFDSVDMLVLADFSPTQLDQKQLTAIKMWVASGGTLVVSGGADYQRLQNPFFTDLLPLDVTGANQVNSLTAMESRFGRPLPPGSTALTVGKLKPGSEVLLAQNGLPLIARRAYGLGEVYLLTADYMAFPLKGWDGQVDMWKFMLISSSPTIPTASPVNFQPAAPIMAPPPSQTPSVTTSSAQTEYALKHHDSALQSSGPGTNPLEDAASDVPSVGAPSAVTIFAFLISYIVCLVPVNYFILSKKRRRELAWFTTPAIILLFTIGAYGIGYAIKGGKLLLKTVTIVEGGRYSQYAAVTTYGGLFSPSRRSYDISTDDPYAVIAQTPMDNGAQRGSRSRDMQVRLGETTQLPEIEMDMWSMRTFRCQSGCDLGGTVDADLNYDKTNRAVGSITNGTHFDLTGCKIIVGSATINVGDLPKKSTKQISTSAASIPGPIPPPTAQSTPTQSPEEDMKANVMQIIATRVNQTGDVQAVLIGWSKRPPTSVNLTRGRGERQSANCYVFRLGQVGVNTK